MQQMAHVVGVPRRDPCQKCQLPVFLAERLVLGKNVFHRTCLKCARCGSQLTPGSFYETEINNEYCCETCPDEEDQLDTKVCYRERTDDEEPNTEVAVAARAKSGGNGSRGVRNSLADRLAFFEHTAKGGGGGSGGSGGGGSTALSQSHKVLEKSVSDEEKRERMGALEALEAKRTQEQRERQTVVTATYKGYAALNSFLYDAIDGDGDGDSVLKSPEDEGVVVHDDISHQTDTATTTPSDVDEPSADSLSIDVIVATSPVPPALPKSEPPPPSSSSAATTTAATATAATANDDVVVPPVASPRFTTKAEVRLMSTEENEQNAIDDEVVQRTTTTTTTKPQMKLDLKATSSNDSVLQKQPEDVALIVDASPEITERLRVVSAQLRALEDVANHQEQQQQQSPTMTQLYTTTAQVLMDVTESQEVGKLQAVNEQMTDDLENILQVKSEELEEGEDEKEVPTETETKDNALVVKLEESIEKEEAEAEKEVEVEEDKSVKVEQSTNAIDNTEEPETLTNNKDIDLAITKNTSVAKETHLDEEETNATIDAAAAANVAINTQQKLEKELNTTEIATATTTTTTTISENKKADKQYPQSLNPFGSDDDEDDEDDSKNAVSNQFESQAKNLLKTPATHTQLMANSTPKDNTKDANLNPFDSSDDEVELEKHASNQQNLSNSANKIPPPRPPPPRISMQQQQQQRNPFGIDNEAAAGATAAATTTPQREPFQRRSSLTSSLGKRGPMPTPRISLSQSQTPTPTPEPTPRLSQRSSTIQHHSQHGEFSISQIYDSSSSLNTTSNSTTATNITTPAPLQRDADVRGSNNSLASSAGGTVRSRKSRRAPAPPPQALKELFPSVSDNASNANSSNASLVTTPTSSRVSSPKSSRKKRPAPAPPKPARLEQGQLSQSSTLLLQDDLENRENSPQLRNSNSNSNNNNNNNNSLTDSKNLYSYPLQSSTLDTSKLSDEEKALLEGNRQNVVTDATNNVGGGGGGGNVLRMIPLDERLFTDDEEEEEEESLKDAENGKSVDGNAAANDTGYGGGGSGNGGNGKSDDLKQQKRQLRAEETNVVYRRMLVPTNMETPTHEANPLLEQLDTQYNAHNRQLEKLKDNKEAQNRNRQSQVSISPTNFDNDALDATSPYYNKSQHGKWKRRKGPAPALPIPPRKVLQMLPLQEIRHELDIIEVQQQGLEKQGVILEKMIRDRCEGQTNAMATAAAATAPQSATTTATTEEVDAKLTAAAEHSSTEQTTSASAPMQIQNSKEVEDLILQLFELVNEKNELFRRQAELMYLRRQHRLEQEQADIEYEIRVLMGQPERNKTDSDKAREEALIARLVEVVELRNEVIECLEMDRLREAEEDLSIKQRLELHNAKRESSANERPKSAAKLSKKEKKQQKEAKKLSKSKKLDADKDADETELKLSKKEKSKPKRKLLFL